MSSTTRPPTAAVPATHAPTSARTGRTTTSGIRTPPRDTTPAASTCCRPDRDWERPGRGRGSRRAPASRRRARARSCSTIRGPSLAPPFRRRGRTHAPRTPPRARRRVTHTRAAPEFHFQPLTDAQRQVRHHRHALARQATRDRARVRHQPTEQVVQRESVRCTDETPVRMSGGRPAGRRSARVSGGRVGIPAGRNCTRGAGNHALGGRRHGSNGRPCPEACRQGCRHFLQRATPVIVGGAAAAHDPPPDSHDNARRTTGEEHGVSQAGTSPATSTPAADAVSPFFWGFDSPGSTFRGGCARSRHREVVSLLARVDIRAARQPSDGLGVSQAWLQATFGRADRLDGHVSMAGHGGARARGDIARVGRISRTAGRRCGLRAGGGLPRGAGAGLVLRRAA